MGGFKKKTLELFFPLRMEFLKNSAKKQYEKYNKIYRESPFLYPEN